MEKNIKKIAKELSLKYNKREIFIIELVKQGLDLKYSLEEIENIIIDFFHITCT